LFNLLTLHHDFHSAELVEDSHGSIDDMVSDTLLGEGILEADPAGETADENTAVPFCLKDLLKALPVVDAMVAQVESTDWASLGFKMNDIWAMNRIVRVLRNVEEKERLKAKRQSSLNNFFQYE
jgi:hypothetical protein